MIERGDWQVSDIARNAYDLEGKVVGTIGAGCIGYRVLQRLVPFDCKELLYYDYNALPEREYTNQRMTMKRRMTVLLQMLPRPSVSSV